MAYTKQNFKDGEVLTAAQLNHIEDGLCVIEKSSITRVELKAGSSLNIRDTNGYPTKYLVYPDFTGFGTLDIPYEDGASGEMTKLTIEITNCGVELILHGGNLTVVNGTMIDIAYYSYGDIKAVTDLTLYKIH